MDSYTEADNIGALMGLHMHNISNSNCPLQRVDLLPSLQNQTVDDARVVPSRFGGKSKVRLLA
jgi:hypothetical protein